MKASKIIPLYMALLSGVLLRLFRLGSHDLWYDEAVSFWTSFLDIRCFWSVGEFGNTQPPLYYFFLKAWNVFLPHTEFWLRLPSVIFGVIAIWVSYKLGSFLFSRSVGIVTGFIMALSPFHIWYSQELRPYVLMPIFAVYIAYFFIKALEEDKILYWIILSILTYFGFLVSYFVGVLLIGEIFVLLSGRFRKYSVKWAGYLLMVTLPMSVVFLPYMINFFSQCLTFMREGFWVQKPSLKSLFITFNNFNVGYTADRITLAVSSIFFFVLFILGFYFGYRKSRERTLVLLILLIVPILFIFLISFFIPVYLDRQLILLSPLYYIFLAVGIEGIKSKILKSFCLACCFIPMALSLDNYYRDILPLPTDYHQGAYLKKPFKPIVEYITDNIGSETHVLAVTNPGIEAPLSFAYYLSLYRDDENSLFGYYRHYLNMLTEYKEGKFGYWRLMRYFYIPETQDEYWRNMLKRKKFISRAVDLEVADIRQLRGKKIIVISGSWSRDGSKDENSLAVNSWMAERFRKISEKEFDGIFVSMYK